MCAANARVPDKQERIAIAGVDDLIIRSLLDRQQFFDPDGDADRVGISSAAWPMFGLLWPSGSHLAARMALHPVSTGGADFWRSDAGSRWRVWSDIAAAPISRRAIAIPWPQAFLEENLRLNQLRPMKYRHGHWNAAAMAAGPPGQAGPLRGPRSI